MARLIVGLLAVLLLAQNAGWREWLNKGIAEYRAGRYPAATEALQQAAALAPGEVEPHLYLGTAYMVQYVPGAEAAGNLAFAQGAEREFARVLELDAANGTALESLASLALNQRKLDEAASWFEKAANAAPNNARAYYSLGVIAWMKFYPEYGKARGALGMKPEDPGPLPDPAARNALRAQFWGVIADGIANLDKALAIDPKYDDAMAYMNLLVRERADLADTKDDYLRDIAAADQWVAKALETKREKAGGPAPAAAGGPRTPIHVGPAVQERKLVRKVEPVYPDEAKRARIQGTVRFTVIVGKDGAVQNVTVISGHPVLIKAALDALRQWRYQPTLLNGEPVEVVTQVEIPFSLTATAPGDGSLPGVANRIVN